MLPIGSLLLTVFTSILEVFLLCVAGYILAGRGILDKKTQKQLNRLNVSLFTPSLLFSKVAFFLSPAKFKELWIIPIFFVFVTALSMTVAYTLGTIFRLRRSQRAFAMAAAMFMNSNSLPIALMQSMVATVHGLKWGKDDNKDAMLGRALTYLVLYSTLGMILRWSYGVRLLAQADDELPQPATSPTDETTPLLSNPPQQSYGGQQNGGSEPPSIIVNPPTNLRPPPMRKRTTFYASFPNTPNRSRVNLSSIESEAPSTSASTIFSPPESETDSDLEEQSTSDATVLPTSTTQGSSSAQPPAEHRKKSKRHWKKKLHHFWREFNDFMTVPLWAALASIVVACIPPLQHALDQHMQPIKGAITRAGNCSIPVTLIVLGAYFHSSPADAVPPAEPTNGRRKSLRPTASNISLIDSVREMFHANKPSNTTEQVKHPGETKTVVIAVLSRMIITPILVMPLVALGSKFDLQAVFEDPVFVVANVLLISSPPALTLAQITQAASGDAFERLISRTIFWAYCIVTPPTTIIYVVIGLVFSKL